jgi:cell wall-associated NlpC family hydrolase
MKNSSRCFWRIALSAFCFVALSACGVRQTHMPGGELRPWMGTVDDIRNYPQNLNVYASAVGVNKRFMSVAAQAAQDARFDRMFFGPWDMPKTSMRRRDVAAIFHKARGYRSGGAVWSQADWDRMAANADLGDFPSRARPAITLRTTDLREMPTHEPRFAKPTPNPESDPFDYFQYSLLPPGTPMLVAHTSRDGRWHFVETPAVGGWVDANDVGIVDDTFRHIWRNGRYAALVRDKVVFSDTSGSDEQGGIGTVLPLSGQSGKGAMRVLFPRRGVNGMAAISEVNLAPEDAVAKPLPLTAGNMARVGNVMMGQAYGWGGMFGNRDCSALTRDLFTPFGLWLPRNSGAQARLGVVRPLDGFDVKEKESIILSDGSPFLSLVGMRGHIALFVGRYKNRALIFHNVWGLRVVEGGNDNSRLVIGRAVVTSISPGLELKNLYRGTVFGDRVRSLSTLTDEAR